MEPTYGNLGGQGLDIFTSGEVAPPAPVSPFNETRLLEVFKRYKEESFTSRYIFEREWQRDLFYIGGRQWIYWNPSTRVYSDKKLAKWMPRPVTNQMNLVLRALHAAFGSINLAVVARPVGHDTESIAAAEIVDQLSPLIHEEHLMGQVLRESDFWMLATGNACLQLSWDTDTRFNKVFIPSEQCLGCGAVLPPQDVVNAGNTCPTCGGMQFMPAQNPDGTPAGEWKAFGRGKTTALSPFEYAFPPNVTRWDDLPYIIRMRWRDKHWFEANQPDLVNRITWEKSPQDRSLQIFKSLALTNDIGTGNSFSSFGALGSNTVEGVTEYELWARPTQEFPQGLVMRVVGDVSPIVLQLPDEGIPGPFPFKDIEGNPLFPFVHAQYEHMGGRLWGRSAISPLIQKQDQLNQIDSLIQLHIQRNANGGWIVPEGAGVENITGEPGLIIRWNPLAAGGNAAGKPERVAGLPIDASLVAYREQILRDIEELCLVGETPIPCLDGEVRSMRELAEQFPEGGMWVYGFDTTEMRVVPAKVEKAWKTGLKPVYRVEFEEGTWIDCTANHPFLTYDRGYVRADELRTGEPIVPCLIKDATASKTQKRYQHIVQPVDRKTEPVHRMVAYALHGLKRGESHLDVHHIDANGLNNLPDNLEVLTRREHVRREPRGTFPRLTPEEYGAFSKIFWDKCEDKNAHLKPMHEGRKAWQAALTPEERKQYAQTNWDNASPEMRKHHASQVVSGMAARTPEQKEHARRIASVTKKAWWAKQSEESKAAKGELLRKARLNHRVKSVTYLGEAEVYDLTTSTGNFGTCAEVFVHNSAASDPLKGEKPKGIEAFSALQLLVERSQSRLTPAFQARGEMYRRWFSLAIELERQFGPQQRTFAVVGPNKGYTFRHFQNAQLQGQITCIVEDGTNMPKTALGKRAAIEQANQLGLINPNDPDQKYALLSNFGLTDLVPSLNFHVQAALQLQDSFERWVEMPEGPPPLVVKPWFDLQIHISERIKWLNTDRMREIIASNPAIEQIVTMHLMQMQSLLMPPPMVGPDGKPQETPGGQAMNNSNQLSGAPAGLPSGNSPAGNNGQNVGPA